MNNLDNIRNVLLVDDDTSITFLMKVALQGSSDWKIESAVSGAEALEKAESFRPDLILLDVMMPGMDGCMTYAKFRDNHAFDGTHIIFVTAKAQATELDAFRKLGVDGVIIKPFDPITLVEEIELQLTQVEAKREANVRS
ncbi:MAG: response regulator [Cyanobacteria bacterium REEB67]|nr:response regulator [Cyanobacteria bacterium REEB67]